MKSFITVIMVVLFFGSSVIINESRAEESAKCEVKTMCVVACGAGYVLCTGKKCEKGKDWVKCDGNRVDCCGGSPN